MLMAPVVLEAPGSNSMPMAVRLLGASSHLQRGDLHLDGARSAVGRGAARKVLISRCLRSSSAGWC